MQGHPPPASSDCRAQALAAVLPLVLQHARAASDAHTLYSLLSTSRACRRAVQQSRGRLNTRSCGKQLQQLPALVSFAAEWLPQHAGLVRHMVLLQPPPEDVQQVAGQVVTLALQHCATRRPARLHGAAGDDEAPPPLVLQLHSFVSSWLHTPAVLRALEPTGVTYLDLSNAAVTPPFCGALAQLSTLQALRVVPVGTPCDALAPALGRLSALTGLSSTDGLTADEVCRLPPSLQHLALAGVRGPGAGNGSGARVLDVSHLTQLRELRARLAWRDDWRVVLPASLTWLGLRGKVVGLSGAVAGLKEVRLQSIDSTLVFISFKKVDGPWQLEVSDADGGGVDTHAMVDAIGQLHGLTGLRLTSCRDDVGLSCAPLAGLAQLRMLDIDAVSLDRAAALSLSALTGLTLLSLQCDHGVDDMVCVALACSLGGLQDFKVSCWDVHTAAMLPAIAADITGLRKLVVHGSSTFGVADDDLLQLTRLQHLTRLSLSSHKGMASAEDAPACSETGVARFLAAVPSVRTVVVPRLPG